MLNRRAISPKSLDAKATSRLVVKFSNSIFCNGGSIELKAAIEELYRRTWRNRFVGVNLELRLLNLCLEKGKDFLQQIEAVGRNRDVVHIDGHRRSPLNLPQKCAYR